MSLRRPTRPKSSDSLLRALNWATSAASDTLDPVLVPVKAADAIVHFLDALRSDVWLMDTRRPRMVAVAGPGGDPPLGLPAPLMRIARGGLAQSLPASELGNGLGVEWRKLMFAIDASHISVHALTVGERVSGAITVMHKEAPSDLVLEAMTIFAQQVAASLEKADMHQSAQDAAISMRIQNRVLSELTDERDVPALRSAVEQLTRDVLRTNVAIALLPIDSTGRVTVPSWSPPSEGTLRVATKPEAAFVSRALESRTAIRLRRPSLALCRDLGLCVHDEQTSNADIDVWGIQLSIGTHAIGTLLLGLRSSSQINSDPIDSRKIIDLLATLAPAVAIALENAQLFAREHLRASRLATANTLARTVAGCSNADELFDAIILGMGALFGFERAAIYSTDLVDLSVSPSAKLSTRKNRERSLVSTTLHRRRSSRVERPDRTCHAMPIASGEHVHAVLYVEHLDGITPEQEQDDLALLTSICEHAAACLVAIDAVLEIERNYKDTIQALVQALEARDQYTADHSNVVAEWAMETGRRLGMGDDALRDLELGAILHDIGKVAIPDDILNKPGRLTDDEFEVMKSHTIIGERILNPIGFLKNVAPIVRYEHERWDGRGYPDGLSETQIPLASRIIFVCDAYHAITSDRPYRDGQPHAFAMRIITENAGTQFDPAVVSIFIDVIDQWRLEHGIIHDSQIDALTGIEIVNPLGAIDSDPDSDDQSSVASAA